MDKMRQLTRSLILVLSVVSVTAVIPAAADTQHIPDDTESSVSPTDMAGVSHGHGDSAKILRHEVHFDGHPSVSERVTLYFRFRSASGNRVRRELMVRENPDGGLYGVFRNSGGMTMGFSRVNRAGNPGGSRV
jgi:hypothetical protein